MLFLVVCDESGTLDRGAGDDTGTVDVGLCMKKLELAASMMAILLPQQRRELQHSND